MEEQGNVSSKSILTWGIVAMIFCESGILGLIFAIVAKNKSKAFVANGNALEGKAKVGSILATVALVISIICLVIYIISGVAGAIGAAQIASSLN